MERTLLLKGASLGTERGILPRGDILVANGIIRSIGTDLPCPPSAEVLNLSGKLLSYGFADLHVHFREPGAPQKETIRTGSLAAARGGYTTVCAMPNLNPAPDSLETMSLEQAIIDRDACIEVLPYATITLGRRGEAVVDMEALRGRCVAFSDDGSGVQHDEVMLAAMRRAAELDCILAAHCEDNTLPGSDPKSEWGQIARDLELAAKTGCRYHICHVSSRESVSLVREAKRSDVRVTCETAPHYLLLYESDVRDEGRFRMNPPIRSAEDREALIEGLNDGTIDAIATDHAPHTAKEKSRGFAGSAMGIVGLETAFPVLYTGLVLEGKLSLERLLDALCTTPRRIFRLGGALREGEQADLTVLDLQSEYTIDSRTFLSKGHATPFDGSAVRGEVILTFMNGKPVWKKESIR